MSASLAAAGADIEERGQDWVCPLCKRKARQREAAEKEARQREVSERQAASLARQQTREVGAAPRRPGRRLPQQALPPRCAAAGCENISRPVSAFCSEQCSRSHVQQGLRKPGPTQPTKASLLSPKTGRPAAKAPQPSPKVVQKALQQSTSQSPPAKPVAAAGKVPLQSPQPAPKPAQAQPKTPQTPQPPPRPAKVVKVGGPNCSVLPVIRNSVSLKMTCFVPRSDSCCL